MAAGIFFLFILLLIIAAWTDLKEGYIPDSVSILIFLLSFLFSFHPVRSRTSIAYRRRCSLRRAFGRDPSYQPRWYWYG